MRWGDFADTRPDVADAGRALLYQFGVGLAFLATTRRDGGPRVHPMCPILSDDGLYAFIVPSPKRDDLLRDGRYALHSFPPADNEDAFYVTGTATRINEVATHRRLAQQFVDERSELGVPTPGDDDFLFEFEVERCLLTRTTGHGDPAPRHEIWHAG